MITEAEARELVVRIAATNVYLRGLMLNKLDGGDVMDADKVCKENSKTLKDFAAAHPETLSMFTGMGGIG